MTETKPYTSRSLSPAQAVLLGTLTVGVLDLIDAIVFLSLRGVSPSGYSKASRPDSWGATLFAEGQRPPGSVPCSTSSLPLGLSASTAS
jgi:hypothetical protein